MPATWRWCARAAPKFRSCWSRRRLRSKARSMRGGGVIARLHLPERFGGQHLPAIEAIDLRTEGPPRGRFIAPRLAEAVQDRARARRAGAVVPQPPRLCAAHAMPSMRVSARLPELRRLAGRSPLPAAARLPPLRLLDAAAGAMPELPGGRTRSSRVGPGVERLEQEAAELFPGQPHPGAVQRSGQVGRAPAQGAGRRRRRPLRHHHRHATRRQGPPFPQAQSGRRRRRRSRPEQRRSARGRADLSAAASGGRPRRAGRRPRHRLPANPSARASGDAAR